MSRNAACEKIHEAMEAFFGEVLTECEPYGSGHINDTFLTVKDGTRYILQRMNNIVFPYPAEMMENIAGVTAHIRAKAETRGEDIERVSLTVVPTKTGKDCFCDSIGSWWRVYLFVENTIARQQVECAEDFEICAEAFGRFQQDLADYPAEKLHETYPDRTFFIIKCAWGNTALYDQWLSPWSKGPRGKHYRNFTTFVDASLKYLKSKNYDIEIAAMCWMQGECDAFVEENGIAYEQNLQDFIGSIRYRYRKYAADGGIAFIDATIANNPMFWVHPEIVNESKRKVADSSHLNVLIDTNAAGLVTANEPEEKPDVPHYDSMSEIKLGHLFAEAVMSFLQ